MSRSLPGAQALSKLCGWLLSAPLLVKVLGIALLVAAIFGSTFLYWTTATLADSLYRSLEQRARASTAWLATTLERPVVARDLEAVRQELVRTVETTSDARYAIVWDSSGRPLAHTFQRAIPKDLERLTSREFPRQCEVEVYESPEGLILDVRSPILEGRGGVLELGFSDRQVARWVAALTRSLLLALGASLLLSAALGLLLAHLLLQPLRHLVRTAQRIGKGDFDARAAVYSGDEAGQLAAELNQMTASLRAYRQEAEEKEKARLFLLDKLVQAQEEERRAISRELHDQLGQSLAALLLTVQSHVPPGHPGREEILEPIRRLSDEVRRLAWGLRPSILDDYGLDSALSRYVQEVTRASGLALDYQYTSPPELGRLPLRIEVTLYRIAQEALTNIVCHAKATRASLVVLRQSHAVTLLVEDDGRGFDAAGLPGDHSLGLTGMRERAALLGGVCLVESRSGAGTTVRVNIPLQRSAPCPSGS